MESLKTRLSVGLGSLALCMSLLFSMFLPVISVQAEEFSNHIYHFDVGFSQMFSFGESITDIFVEYSGNDIDFVSISFQNNSGGLSTSIYAFSFEPFTYNASNFTALHESKKKVVNSVTVYYAEYRFGTSADVFRSWGAPNIVSLINIDSFNFLENNIEIKLDELLQEFVTNGGIDWDDTFLYPDDSNISGIGGGDIQDLEAFISDYVLYCSWSGLGGSIPGASTKSFISPTLLFADKDDPENTDLIRSQKYFRNFWVSDYSLEIDFRSLLKENEYLYGVRLTPYYYTDDNDIKTLMQGFSSTIYFDVNGDWDEDKNGPSHGGGSHPPDSSRTFSLTGIYVESSEVSQPKIHWRGTTIDEELSNIPNENKIVIADFEFVDNFKNVTYLEYGTTTIDEGYLTVVYSVIQALTEDSGLSWTGRVRLEPAYTVDNVTHFGKYSYIDFENGSITGGDLGDGSSDFDYTFPSFSDATDYAKLGLGFLSSLVDIMGSFPKLIAAVFSFIPDIYIQAIGAFIIVIFIARILGR